MIIGERADHFFFVTAFVGEFFDLVKGSDGFNSQL